MSSGHHFTPIKSAITPCSADGWPDYSQSHSASSKSMVAATEITSFQVEKEDANTVDVSLSVPSQGLILANPATVSSESSP